MPAPIHLCVPLSISVCFVMIFSANLMAEFIPRADLLAAGPSSPAPRPLAAGQDSLRGRVLRELGAPWRLLLTGTPLQNNLRELLALLAFMADCKIEDIERRVKVRRVERGGVEEAWPWRWSVVALSAGKPVRPKKYTPFLLTNPPACPVPPPLSGSLQRMADPNPPSPVAASQAEDADEELLQAQAYIRCADGGRRGSGGGTQPYPYVQVGGLHVFPVSHRISTTLSTTGCRHSVAACPPAGSCMPTWSPACFAA